MPFPKGFYWGAATAGHQVEGNNVNTDNWLLEHVPGTIFVEPSGDACDHYHRYPEDIALLAELGFNTYRFSLEWARIEPEEGEFSRASLDHYRRMLAVCHERGLTPMVTFHHTTSPRWLITSGGWEDPATPDRFARFCQRATQHLGDLIGVAATINEANLPRLFAESGRLAPPSRQQPAAWWSAAARKLDIAPDRLVPFLFASSDQSVETILAAHRRAREAIKSGPGNFPVGLTLALEDIQAGEGGEALAGQMRQKINDVYLENLGDADFVGVQTYSRLRFGPNGALPPEAGVELTQVGSEFWPEALETTIRYASAKTGLPVIVTENGLATSDDTRRMAYIQQALQGVAHCLNDGLDVRGYIHWSAFDNFEWMMGYGPTFGLIAVDHETQTRKVRPSARWLGKVAQANGF